MVSTQAIEEVAVFLTIQCTVRPINPGEARLGYWPSKLDDDGQSFRTG